MPPPCRPPAQPRRRAAAAAPAPALGAAAPLLCLLAAAALLPAVALAQPPRAPAEISNSAIVTSLYDLEHPEADGRSRCEAVVRSAAGLGAKRVAVVITVEAQVCACVCVCVRLVGICDWAVRGG